MIIEKANLKLNGVCTRQVSYYCGPFSLAALHVIDPSRVPFVPFSWRLKGALHFDILVPASAVHIQAPVITGHLDKIPKTKRFLLR